MGLRPASARWFEVLTPCDDLARTAEVLARTGEVEIEAERSMKRSPDDPQVELAEARRLVERYQRHLPTPDFRSQPSSGEPRAILRSAIAAIRAWADRADPLVIQAEHLESERVEVLLLSELGQSSERALAQLARMADGETQQGSRLFVIEQGKPVPNLPGIVQVTDTERHVFLAVLAPQNELRDAEQTLDESEIRRVAFDRHTSVESVAARLGAVEIELGRLRDEIADLSEAHRLATLVADIRRLDWFLTHVPPLEHTRCFGLITGWTSDIDTARLRRALDESGVNALIRFPSAHSEPPTVLQNPGWAKPFESLSRLLGAPSRNEADPSVLLVVLAPLLFGFMFADVGQGAVLVVAGLLLRRKRPALAMLIPGGIAAMVFGMLFGSVFGREDLVPALWVHPLEAPIDVIVASVLLGAAILTLGFALSALEAHWRRSIGVWLTSDGALLLVYLGLLSSFVHAVGAAVAGIGALIFVVSPAIQKRRARAMFSAAGELAERGLQLGVNSVSFARVGAFALAHAGLSVAIVELSNAAGGALVGVIVLVIGNALALVLEGLVVAIQTTRLVLFEFFARFLRADGRVFLPLVPPASNGSIGGQK